MKLFRKMKKLIFDLFKMVFSLSMLYAIYQEGLTTENNFVFPFAMFFLASLTTLVMVLTTVTKLFSK